MNSWPVLFVVGLGTLSALLTVFHKNPIHSALFLVLTLLSVATSFLLLRADFLAMIQVIVYAGAIMVLIIFVLLLTARDPRQKERLFHRQSPMAIVIGLCLIAELVSLLSGRNSLISWRLPSAFLEGQAHTFKALGKLLFTKYAFPFELVSVLLLVALVAAVAIAKKEEAS
ncbi:MAG: NADH-quinone oxidoreductase subunit J [Candidatus Omnitrophota bacterium]